MQGPFVSAAEQFKEHIHDIINSRLGIELNLCVIILVICILFSLVKR